ncbi:hypothetical protein, partial [Arthrobacter sp. GMC3]|uniref:hypothetical protein n=1 Tax=Arthrobacter sp. GMC3 TaxID=2058894 RepID=UPI001CA5BB13
MGTADRPGSRRVSTPSGPEFLDQGPGHGSGVVGGGSLPGDDCGDVYGDDVVMARLVASDPFADDPMMLNVTWVGPSREISAEEWADLFLPSGPVSGQGTAAPIVAATPLMLPLPDSLPLPGSLPVPDRLPDSLPVSLSGVGEVSRVAVIRASVPDHPKAPR